MPRGERFLVILCLIIIIATLPVTSAAQPGSREDQPIQSAEDKNNSFYNRIMNIINSYQGLDFSLPQPKDKYRETSIFGPPEISKSQIAGYIRAHNPTPRVNCTLEELIDIYYEEAGAEGIRPDLALAQAVLETGFFRFGGDVVPEQNNFSGLGTTGKGVKGEWFSSPRIGVRAHIQHLLVYASSRQPAKPIVDPRYEILRELPSYFAQCPTWESLSGKWAIPGVNYGYKIIDVFENMKNFNKKPQL